MLRDLGSRDSQFLDVVKFIRTELLRVAGMSECGTSSENQIPLCRDMYLRLFNICPILRLVAYSLFKGYVTVVVIIYNLYGLHKTEIS